MTKKTIFTILILSLFGFLSGCINNNNKINFTNTGTIDLSTGTKKVKFDTKNIKVSTWTENLEIPWGITFLDKNTALVTQRGGKISLIKNGNVQIENYWKADSRHIGEGGLMGITKHPNFQENNYIYVMYTFTDTNGQLKNRVLRLVHQGNTAKKDKIILDNIPGAIYHNGGRIEFGPNGKLYITAGDAKEPDLAQNTGSLAGKILRLNSDGSVPKDNPFENSPVYSYGHRNPQGLAWEPATNELFISNHGPTGEFGWQAKDRIDHIIKGGNYGWPEVPGYSEKYQNPLVYWPDEATPPSGMTFWYNRLFVATLGSESLIMIKPQKENGTRKVAEQKRLFENKFGRLRTAKVGPDGNMYILTSNRDGRGTPNKGDDKILKLELK